MWKIIVTWASQWLWYDLADYLSGNWNKVVWISRTKSDLDIQHISTDFSDKGSILQTIFNILDIHNDASTIIICAAIGAKIWYKANKFIPVYSMTKWGLREW